MIGGGNPRALGRPDISSGGDPRNDELQTLLELFVGQELVSPFGQSLLDLVAQAFAELHDRKKKGKFGGGFNELTKV